MNSIGVIFRLVGQLISHPASQKLINHAIRLATAELVHHIQRKTRGRSTKISYS